jgi:hypothetical protein
MIMASIASMQQIRTLHDNGCQSNNYYLGYKEGCKNLSSSIKQALETVYSHTVPALGQHAQQFHLAFQKTPSSSTVTLKGRQQHG